MDDKLPQNSISLDSILKTINLFPHFLAIKNEKSHYIAANNMVASAFGYKSPQTIVERNLLDSDIRAPAASLAEDFFNAYFICSEEKQIEQ